MKIIKLILLINTRYIKSKLKALSEIAERIFSSCNSSIYDIIFFAVKRVVLPSCRNEHLNGRFGFQHAAL